MTRLRAAVTLGLTGRYAVQASQARMGLELWAENDDVELHVRDDAGSPTVAAAEYREFLAGDFDILLGPYGSGLVRRVAATICTGHRLLWNHGGAATDVARPGLVSVPAPASTYLLALLTLCRRRGVESVVLVRGSGPFARQVIDGARHHADTIGLAVSVADLASWQGEASLAGRALLIAGTFEEDVETVRRIRTAAVDVDLVGCVAAGIHEFEARLGPLADGVLAPAQWVNRDHPVDIGLTATAFARRFEARTGTIPDYPAAQAAATGWLAANATRRGLTADEVHRWQTTTLLGAFALDPSWRQVGHTPVVVQWRRGRLDPL
jgi:branched-chain amino acid transport system substrate-binding protein